MVPTKQKKNWIIKYWRIHHCSVKDIGQPMKVQSKKQQLKNLSNNNKPFFTQSYQTRRMKFHIQPTILRTNNVVTKASNNIAN